LLFLSYEPVFTKSEYNLLHYIQQHLAQIPVLTINQLSINANTSIGCIQRFCKKMQCTGFTEFKVKLDYYIQDLMNTKNKSPFLDEINLFIDWLNTQSYNKILDEFIYNLTSKTKYCFCVSSEKESIQSKKLSKFLSNIFELSLSITYEEAYRQNFDFFKPNDRLTFLLISPDLKDNQLKKFVETQSISKANFSTINAQHLDMFSFQDLSIKLFFQDQSFTYDHKDICLSLLIEYLIQKIIISN
jgi:DNA-binding MurR/RpiR family transcriptional regulator